MVMLKLPDGSVREVAPGTNSRQVAESIGKRLAMAVVAAKVNGEIVDLERELQNPPRGRRGLAFEFSIIDRSRSRSAGCIKA